MKRLFTRYNFILLLLLAILIHTVCPSCNVPRQADPAEASPAPGSAAYESARADRTGKAPFLTVIEDEPDTVDFQCTSLHYTIALNVFNRLVETEIQPDGSIAIVPSLVQSWEESDDGLTYDFHLREGVAFSNGSPLTSSDVLYTLTRLLTHPDSCNKAIAEPIKGAKALADNETDHLEGFTIIDDLNFRITLELPFEAFLSCLSMAGASILDEETTEAAGAGFGLNPEQTIGTGPFVISQWMPGYGIVLTANENCWSGMPRCAGVNLLFITDENEAMQLFDNGGLDILDIDELGYHSEYYMQGDIYQDRLQQVRQVGISYIALNESVAPLNDVRVRRALQLALNRSLLLEAVYSGRGSLENGIFPHGLYGFNPDLDDIPYDPDEARRLLAEAGYPDGFELAFSVKNSSTQSEAMLANMAVRMWNQIGIKAAVNIISEEEFMSRRKSGLLECYTATWIADYNDPDNFIHTFFGNEANTLYRSLCYGDKAIMDRVNNARTITNPQERLEEYHSLEKKIVQEDAAWIPLFSRLRYYVTSERLNGFTIPWNGSVKRTYARLSITES